jgi:hypothetical protein
MENMTLIEYLESSTLQHAKSPKKITEANVE